MDDREVLARLIAEGVDGMTPVAYEEASQDYRNEMLEGADKILSSHWLKRVKADVWDEGNSAGYREGRGGSIYSTNEDLRNPYRERVNYLKDLRD